MAYIERDNTGSLFINDRKEKETHPDHKGTFTLNGVQYEIAAWKKQSQRGEFLSLSVKPKQERRAPPEGFPTAKPPIYSEDVNF
jgi:hypothetical protein